jgi:hypothetical protein
MLFDWLIQVAGFAAIAGAIFLFSINVLVVVARLLKNKELADNVVKRLAPFAEVFRLETPRGRNGT